MKRLYFIYFALTALTLLSSDVDAAPCCAGSTALPSLITGDEAQNFNVAISYGTVVGDASGALEGQLPVFRDEASDREIRENLTLNYATLVDDLYQVGVSVPMVRNEMASGGRSASKIVLADISFTGGYEILPEYEYTLWVPRVYLFSQIILPTGRAMAVSEAPLGTDVAGLGQWQFHFGSTAIKRWSDWDAMAVVKLGRLFSKGFVNSSGETTQIGASWGLSASMGCGYSFAERYRLGLSLEPQYQSPVESVSGIGARVSSQKLVWNTGLTATALVGADSSLVAGYTDQTVFGPAINTTLARTFSFSYQHRFER